MKTWQIRTLGGAGSGHHGHKGIPGHRGGSLPKGASGGLQLFHGGRSTIVDSVLSEGLKIGKEWHYRPPSVYTAEDPQLALGYAIDRAKNIVPQPKHMEAVVFEIRVPPDNVEDFVPDDKLPGLTIEAGQISNTSWRVAHDVPKDWIVGYKVYRADTSTRKWWTAQSDEQYKQFEVVQDVKLQEYEIDSLYIPIVYIPED